MNLLLSLRAFCSVSELGSLTRSAAAMGIGQSVLSRQISALEVKAGARLLHRTGRGAVPTEIGQRLLPRAKAILDDSAALLSELRGAQASPVGTVDLGVVPAVRPVVAQLYARLQRDYPRIRLRAHEAFSGQVEEWLAGSKVEVGLFNRYGRGTVRDGQALLRSPMVVIGPRGMPLVRRPQIEFRQLAAAPMAIPIRPNALLAMLESTAARLKVDLTFAFESGSEAITMDSVANAGLCTVVPLHVATRNYGAERFGWSLVVDPSLTQTTWMAQPSTRPLSPASRIVANILREITPELAADSRAPRRADR